MNWHPVTLALLLAEAISMAIYAAAAGRLFAILPAWQAGADDGDQLSRERALEVIRYQAVWVAALQALGFALLIVGISNLWTPFVPGAMCGMGVLQALGAAGRQALLFKALALLVFYCWYAAVKIENRVPEATAVGFHGRLLLLAAPFMVLGAWSLAKALAGINSAQPVSCCAALYDLALGNTLASPKMIPGVLAWVVWVVAGLPAALAAVGWGWIQWSRPRIAAKVRGNWPVVLIWAGLPAAFMVITRGTAPYALEVLWHPCPWCLLLSEHGAPGIFFFGLPAWVAAESLVVAMAGHMVRHNAALTPFALQRVQQAGLRMIIITLVWVAMMSLPGLWWFLRFGDWIR